MKSSFRWYGESDPVKLEYIRQIPGMRSIVSAVYDVKPGEVWPEESIRHLTELCREHGLIFDVVESIPVTEEIKLGKLEREQHIQNYCESVRRCAKYGIKCITYNFMPVFDWTRTELDRVREDGSTVMAYNQDAIDKMDPEKMFDAIKDDMNGTVMPGWEPERMAKIKDLFALYKGIDEDQLFEDLKYFLEAIMPVCDKYDINMAIHPDDPGWSVFGLPRIISSQEKLKRMMDMVPNKHNGVTFCMGSYGTNLNNDLIATIHMLKGRIHFAHIRNLRFNDGMRDFEESAHLSEDGTFDMYAVIKALYEDGFDGPIRPDHGRMIWGEKAMPGYGLYDRALGAAYLRGLWEAAKKEGEQR